MQKHERAALRVAQEEAARYGLTASFHLGRHEKADIVLHDGDKFVARRVIAASPRDKDIAVSNCRQWVRRVAKHWGDKSIPVPTRGLGS